MALVCLCKTQTVGVCCTVLGNQLQEVVGFRRVKYRYKKDVIERQTREYMLTVINHCLKKKVVIVRVKSYSAIKTTQIVLKLNLQKAF